MTDILNILKRNTGYSITYKSADFVVIPTPYLELTDVNVDVTSNQKMVNIIKLKTMKLNFSWIQLLSGNISIEDINISSGFLKIGQAMDQVGGTAQNSQAYYRHFEVLETVTGDDIAIDWIVNTNNVQETRTFHIIKASIERDDKSDFKMILHGDHKDGKAEFTGSIEGLDLKNPHIFKTSLNLNFGFRGFPLFRVINYFIPVPAVRILASQLGGIIKISKKKLSDSLEIECSTTVYNLIAHRDVHVQPVTVTGKMNYNLTEKKISITSYRFECPKTINASGAGAISFKGNIRLYLFIKMRYADSEGLIDLSSLIEDRRGPGNRRIIHAAITLIADKFAVCGLPFANLSGTIVSDNYRLNITVDMGSLYGGSVTGTGSLKFSKNQAVSFRLLYSGALIENIINHFTDNKYISGTLQTRISCSSHGVNFDDYLKNIRGNISLIITNGNLYGYANVLNPIFKLGKFINMLGPKGKSSGFQKLGSNISIANQKIYIDNLKVKGVAFDATGDGWIGFNGIISMDFMVGLGGVKGKVVRVPILYRGRIPHNVAFVDPLWLGSAYAGMLIMPGPLGAVGGATAYSVIKNIVDKIKKKKKK